MIQTLVVDDDYQPAHAHALSVARVAGFSVAGEAHSAEEARGGPNVPAARISASIWAGEYG